MVEFRQGDCAVPPYDPGGQNLLGPSRVYNITYNINILFCFVYEKIYIHTHIYVYVLPNQVDTLATVLVLHLSMKRIMRCPAL